MQRKSFCESSSGGKTKSWHMICFIYIERNIKLKRKNLGGNMKKFFVIAFVMMIGAASLMAYPNLYWHVSSDHTCSTHFYVGEHPDYDVTITRIRCDVNGIPYSWASEVDVDTLGQYDHYLTSGYCPNFRVLYRAYYETAAGRKLASTRLYVIRPQSSTAPGNFCAACADYNHDTPSTTK
jgi:hypothetical protein